MSTILPRQSGWLMSILICTRRQRLQQSPVGLASTCSTSPRELPIAFACSYAELEDRGSVPRNFLCRNERALLTHFSLVCIGPVSTCRKTMVHASECGPSHTHR